MLFYRAALPLSSLLVLVHLKKGETFAQAAAGFGVGTTTAWRYVEETVVLLAARAPKHHKHGMNLQVIASPLR
jgi:hypothetical protein